MEKIIQERVEQLNKTISRCQIIVEGLEKNHAFGLLVEDWKKIISNADENWQVLNLQDPNQMATYHQLRSMKVAGKQLINTIEAYKYEIDRATKELAELEHPEDIQSSYVDPL